MALAKNAPVAQLDRAPDYESGGQEFESLRARQIATIQNKTANSGPWIGRLRSAPLLRSYRAKQNCVKRRAGYQAIGYKVLGTSDLFSGQVVASNEPAEATQ